MSSKKNTIIGVTLLVAALALFVHNSQQATQNAPRQPQPVADNAGVVTPAIPPQTPGLATSVATSTANAAAAIAPAAAAAPVAPVAPAAPEQIVTLGNESVRLAITTRGGGLRNVALLKHADTLANHANPAKSPYFFNTKFAPVPALSFRQDSTNLAQPELWAPDFTVVEAPPQDAAAAAPASSAAASSPASSATASSSTASAARNTGGTTVPLSAAIATSSRRVVLTATPAPGLVVTRTYELADPAPDAATGKTSDPNLVKVTTSFRNTGGAQIPARNIRLNTGTLPPEEGDTYGQFLSVSAYDGDEFQRKLPADFAASGGFLGMGGHGESAVFRLAPASGAPWKWVAVTNQYFAGIYRFAPAAPGAPAFTPADMLITPVRERVADPATGEVRDQIHTATGDIGFSLPALAPGQEVVLAGEYYVGPREYTRLAKLGQGEEKAVQFTKYLFISMDFLCKLFTVVLDTLHSLIPASVSFSWGLAIILLTLIVKALTWPLVAVQQRSAERMRKFQGPMKAIREKYKDDPRRQQQEMMKLYQEHKINPFAGCLPMLIQMPVFIGLFFTFQSLAQLRFQPFLWITDLSRPDLIPGLENFTILGVHLHILPLFMGLTMLLNMRLSPMPNMEGQQKVIFYGMMLIVPVFCYAMPAALMLYYSVQNVLTIFQTLHTRRRLRNEDAAQPAASAVIDLPSGGAAASGNGGGGGGKKNNNGKARRG